MATPEELENQRMLDLADGLKGIGTPGVETSQPAIKQPVNTQPLPTLQSLQGDVQGIRDAYAAEQEAILDYQTKSLPQRSRTKFLNPGQSFADAFSKPSEAQRAFAFNAGLALLSSSGTNNLSQRIGQALGSGMEGMQKERERKLTLEQQQSKLNLAALKSKREFATKNFDLNRTLRSEETVDIGREDADTKREAVKETALFTKKQRDKTLAEQSRDNKRGNISEGNFNTNQQILNSRGVINESFDNGVTSEMINAMKQARVVAQKQGLPEDSTDTDKFIAQIMQDRFGDKTIPNEVYNRQYIDQLEMASKPLYTSDGIADPMASFYLEVFSGQVGQEAKDAIGRPSNITPKMVNDVASILKRQDPNLSESEAQKLAAQQLRDNL
tara:strand:+ start:27 stop:1181 length:1155 start_codon:yes stop_codon:yes gene_type:complete